MFVALVDVGHLLTQLGLGVDDRALRNAHPGAFPAGLDEHGEAHVVGDGVVDPLEGLEGRRGQVVVGQHALGHGLIQGQGQGEHTRTGVGDAQHLQDGGHLRFAGVAEMAFGNVETDIRVIFTDRVQQGVVPFQELTFMPAGADRLDQGIDRIFRIQVGPLVLAHPFEVGGVFFEICE